jgi:hypothetical protein
VKPLRLLLVYAAAAVALLYALAPVSDQEPVVTVPPLPAEASVAGSGPLCGEELPAALKQYAFRWVAPRSGARVWKRGLTVTCDAGPDAAVIAALDGTKALWHGTVARRSGADGDALTAAVAARLLWERPEVADAAVRAYFANQEDVARAGADLWRVRRFREAAETLSGALENGWDAPAQAQLYYGLAESEARLGRPRQAFWYALAYLGLAGKEPPEDWVRTLRGAASLMASQPSTVEPEARELARRADAERRAGDFAAALRDLKALCRAAPWSDAYQLETAAFYDRLGWRALADSWKRRAALTRALAADGALQSRAAGLLQ